MRNPAEVTADLAALEGQLRPGTLLFDTPRGHLQIRFGDRVFVTKERLSPGSLIGSLTDLGLAGHPGPAPSEPGEKKTPLRVGVLGSGAVGRAVRQIAPAVSVSVVELDGPPTGQAAGFDVLLAGFDSLRPDTFEQINRWSMTARVPWVPLYLETTGPVIGPFTDPFRTPCWHCTRLRRRAATTRLDELEDYWSFLASQPEEYAVPNVSSAGDLAAAVALVLADCTAWQSGAVPRSAGYLVEVLPGQQPLVLHPVLPVPSCPVCGDDVRDQLSSSRG